MDLNEKIILFSLCMRRAHAMGYGEIEYTHFGFNLMKHNRVLRSFYSLEELDGFLRDAQKRWVKLGKSLHPAISIHP